MYIKVKDKLINLDMATVINVAATAQRYNPESDKYDSIDNCVRINFFGATQIEFINEEADIARAEIRHSFEGYLI